MKDSEWRQLNAQITACRFCPRLVKYREEVGRVKKPCYEGQEYWSKPLTGMGDRNGRLLILGLAPAAHGGNRTGRIFTGGSSASFLLRALFKAGFANQPNSDSCDDGLQLRDVYLTNMVRCAPPANKPTPLETASCGKYLIRELNLLPSLRVVVPLGAFAMSGYLRVLRETGMITRSSLFPFQHRAGYRTHPGGPVLVPSYHPSQQNTFTKILTPEMMSALFQRARLFMEATDSTA